MLSAWRLRPVTEPENIICPKRQVLAYFAIGNEGFLTQSILFLYPPDWLRWVAEMRVWLFTLPSWAGPVFSRR